LAILADLKAQDMGFTKEDLDIYTAETYKRAYEHRYDHKPFLVPFVLSKTLANGRVIEQVIECDEGATKVRSLEAIQACSPLEGCKLINRYHASKRADGAAFMIIASEEAVHKYGLKPLARIIGFASHNESEAKDFIVAPAGAIQKALTIAGLAVSNIDAFEINEAFAVSPMAVMKILGLPREKVNVYGSSIVHGHPFGETGTANAVKLVTIMINKGLRFGVLALCSAKRKGIAVVFERI